MNGWLAFSYGFPEVNATLNITCGVLLVLAFCFIKAGKWRAHGYTMVAATLVSVVFLACYLTYHALHSEKSTRLHSHDWLRRVYLLVLIPHLILAMVVLPMIVMTLTRAYRRQWSRHTKISTPTFWIWIYVSFSGVVVYLMLYHTRLR